MPYSDDNTNLVTIIVFGINEYDNLKDLPGTKTDIQTIREVLLGNVELSVYREEQIRILENSTLQEAQQAIKDYITSRTARGDILIFYFAGHGAVLSNGDFYFCMKDTVNGFEQTGFLPISALSLREIIYSLSNADIIPCFIIDACFSGATCNIENVNIGLNMEYVANKTLGNNYAILASSGGETFSYENMEGGYFTNSIKSLVENGLPKRMNARDITIQNMTEPINRLLSKKGAPLSRLHLGESFPTVILAKNKNFSEITKSETFVHSYKSLFEFIYRDGIPKPFTPGELRADHASAYGNNKKLIYVWGLLEEVTNESKGRVRKLTQKGIDFYNNKIKIARKMVKLSGSTEWTPANGTDFFYYKDI